MYLLHWRLDSARMLQPTSFFMLRGVFTSTALRQPARSVDGLDHLRQRNCIRRTSDPVPALHASGRYHQTMMSQLVQDVGQHGERNLHRVRKPPGAGNRRSPPSQLGQGYQRIIRLPAQRQHCKPPGRPNDSTTGPTDPRSPPASRRVLIAISHQIGKSSRGYRTWEVSICL